MAANAEAGANAVPTAYLSVLLFNVNHGQPPKNTKEGESDRESFSGISDDQAAGIEAVLISDPVKNAQNLLVLTSEQGETDSKLSDKLKYSLGIKDKFLCNETVGIFQRCTETDNFNTTFLGNNDRAAFAKVTVPLNGGNVKILLVSYHGKHARMKIEEKQNAFSQLISDSDGMKRCLGCKAVIIGGDFNLSLSKAMEGITHEQALLVDFWGPDANVESLLDYVVFWSDSDDVKLERAKGHPKFLKWTNELNGIISDSYPDVVKVDRPASRKCLNGEPFDHPRLLYRFNVTTKDDKNVKALASKTSKMTVK